MSVGLGEQAIEVEWSATKVTAKTIKEIIQALLAGRNELSRGSQSLKKLNLHERQLESVELSGNDIRAFRRELNKYAVDFAVMKNKGTGTFSVFFKAQDVDRVYSGLEKCVEQFSKSEKRRSLHDRLEDAKRESQARNQIEKNSPEKEVGRGKEER